MTPIFKVEADGQDITQVLATRLVEITIDDNSGVKADRVSIEIDDGPALTGDSITFPVEGTKLTVWLGYLQSPNQEFLCPLIQVGVYVLNEITCKKNTKGRALTIVGHAISHEGTFKQPRNVSYHNKKLGDIVTECCARNGMEAVVESIFGNIQVNHIDQTNESDIGFLTRLYDIYGAIAKPINGKLIFGSPTNVRTLLGDQSNVVPVDAISMSEWRYVSQGKGKFTAVRAVWHDKDKGKDFTVSSEPSEGHDETYYTIPKVYDNQESATEAAANRKEAFANSECSFNFTTLGNPQFVAGSMISLFGLRPGIPTEWRLTKVQHKFNAKGFTTECDCDTKWKADASNVSTTKTPGSVTPKNPELNDPDLPQDTFDTSSGTSTEEGNSALALEGAEVPDK